MVISQNLSDDAGDEPTAKIVRTAHIQPLTAVDNRKQRLQKKWWKFSRVCRLSCNIAVVNCSLTLITAYGRHLLLSTMFLFLSIRWTAVRTLLVTYSRRPLIRSFALNVIVVATHVFKLWAWIVLRAHDYQWVKNCPWTLFLRRLLANFNLKIQESIRHLEGSWIWRYTSLVRSSLYFTHWEPISIAALPFCGKVEKKYFLINEILP